MDLGRPLYEYSQWKARSLLTSCILCQSRPDVREETIMPSTMHVTRRRSFLRRSLSGRSYGGLLMQQRHARKSRGTDDRSVYDSQEAVLYAMCSKKPLNP